MVEDGHLRLSPASYYLNPDHDKARKDDELHLRTFISPYDFDLGLITPPLAQRLPQRSWAQIHFRKPSDHYIFCVSASFDFRYFFDFAGPEGIADSCVLIYNQDEFIRRLTEAAKTQLAGWAFRFDGMRYIDPYFMIDRLAYAGDDIYLFKEFKFLYQHEYRLVAAPSRKTEGTLNHLSLHLGSLSDISKLIQLDLREPCFGGVPAYSRQGAVSP